MKLVPLGRPQQAPHPPPPADLAGRCHREPGGTHPRAPRAPGLQSCGRSGPAARRRPASQEFSHSPPWEGAEAPDPAQAGIQGWGWGQRGQSQGRWARECPPTPAAAGRPEAGPGPAGGGGPHSPPSLREEGSQKHISKPRDLPQTLHCPDRTAPAETAEGTAPREALLVTGRKGHPSFGGPAT